MWATLLSVLIALAAVAYALSRLFQRVVVRETEHVVLINNGRIDRALTPGTYWFFRPRSHLETLPARAALLTMPTQEVLTADNVALRVSLLMSYVIESPVQTVSSSESYEAELYAHAQLALRAAIAARDIESILSSRVAIGDDLEGAIRPRAEALGIKVTDVAVKDVTFPGPLREAFAQAAKARQAAQAKLEEARGEMASLRSLANSARMLSGNPELAQLRLLQTLDRAETVHVTVADPNAVTSSRSESPESG
ncbi:MAG: SPFH domain-containing protein [Pseudomonadota bacterium]